MEEKEYNEENKRYMISNLEEAREEIDTLIKELEEPDCIDAGFIVGFAHLYHHINFAWNIRHVDNEKEDRIGWCREEDYNQWIQFPKDIEDLIS